MTSAFDEIVRKDQNEMTKIELALYTLWSEIMGYEQMAIDAADELAQLRKAAERLAEAAGDVWGWIQNWEPEFTEDSEWEETEKNYLSALSDYEKAGQG